jgi:hypothetical protein
VLGFKCRAIGQINNYEIQILVGDLSERYAPLAIVVQTPKETERSLPNSFKSNAEMLLDGEHFAAGEVISTGDVIGGKNSAHYARATFAKIKLGIIKLQNAHKLTLIAEDEAFARREIELQDMDQIIGLLKNCTETRGNTKLHGKDNILFQQLSPCPQVKSCEQKRAIYPIIPTPTHPSSPQSRQQNLGPARLRLLPVDVPNIPQARAW